MADTGHAKIIESLGKLIARSETLDQTRLNPPPEMTLPALNNLLADAAALQTKVGDSRAVWRTAARESAAAVELLDSLAAQAVAQLEARGAGAEVVGQARGYVRKLQGARSSEKAVDDPNTPDVDESEQSVSASQQSRAAQIANFNELVDFLEAQAAYAGVSKTELLVASLRATADAAQAKHDASIEAAANLSGDRIKRNNLFYLGANNICDLARRFKSLVKGEYGAVSPEYKAVNAIPFKKPKL